MHLTLTFSLLSAFPHERFLDTSAPDRVPPFSYTQSPFSRRSVGGATFSHWSGEKEACLSSDPGIAHVGRPCSLKLKGLESDSATLLRVVLQQEEEEVEVEAMVGGWRKMAAV